MMRKVLLVTDAPWREQVGWQLGQVSAEIQLLWAPDGLWALHMLTQAVTENQPFSLVVLDEKIARLRPSAVGRSLRALEESFGLPPAHCLFLSSLGEAPPSESAPAQSLPRAEESVRCALEVSAAIYQLCLQRGEA